MLMKGYEDEDWLVPVSYTHLDVYKRQAAGCAGTGDVSDRDSVIAVFQKTCALPKKKRLAGFLRAFQPQLPGEAGGVCLTGGNHHKRYRSQSSSSCGSLETTNWGTRMLSPRFLQSRYAIKPLLSLFTHI